MKSSAALRIGELAGRFGLAPHVLRHWEAMGLLTPAARVNGRRVYTDEHVVRVMTIVRAKEGGLSLEQIRAMLDAPGRDERQALLRRQHAALERRIAALNASKALIEHVMECAADDILQCPGYRRLAENPQAIGDARGNACVAAPSPHDRPRD
ncbi:MerR family transcriptional regulator [Actinomadura chibensis]|uniref:MerR family transcriptional regulator n=1 Tax=Actinomadura chibensis TaxID=392828 RepID=A0A5D0NYZ1_9ACTN|nr:MerR family transcriptional regulator [Actinomadura chibensis]TYB49542.1 MerR family transcriptional regulator [Actinomadura chibensis]